MATMFFNERLLPQARDPNALILYPHAQRTGGVTIRKRVFAELFGEAGVYNRHYDRSLSKKLARLTDKDFAPYKAWTETENFTDIRLSRPTLWIAVLRHPLYRAASLYFYVQRKEGHRDQELARQTNIEEFYRHASARTPKYYRNMQCLRVCGETNGKLAIETIREKYLAAGFTGQLSDFVTALGGLFGWRPLDIETKGGDDKRYDDVMTPAFRSMVLDENRDDLRLYEAVRAGLR